MRRFVPDKWGGTESVVYNLSRMLSADGIESAVFCTAMFSRPGPAVVDGIPVRRYRYLFPWFGLSGPAKHQLRLKGGNPLSLPLFFGLLRDKDLSLIHTHVQHRLGGMARTAAKWKRIPYVVTVHGGYYTLPREQVCSMIRPVRGRFEWGRAFGLLFGARRVLEDAHAIICVGQNEYQEMRKHHPAGKVFYLPNGVNVERFRNADGNAFRSAFGFSPGERLALCVSRIDSQKNQVGLVRAFARFAETHPAHRLVLIGPVSVTDYHEQLLAEISRLGLRDRVRLLPGMRPDDAMLANAYRAAEWFVLASLHEPFGIVILEAWAAGIPVLAYAVGGIPGFCRNRSNSLLVAEGDEGGLAAGMAELADGEALRHSLSDRAAEEVAAYDWPVITAKLRELYRRI